jgi:hypothetical protein
MNWTAWLYLLIGAAMLLLVARRKFYRRNAHGIEEFRSFGGMLITTVIENAIAVVGTVLVVVGILGV